MKASLKQKKTKAALWNDLQRAAFAFIFFFANQ